MENEIKVLTDIQHVLQRPEMYIGQVTNIKQKRWILENKKLVEKEIEYIPAILKLFDEVISNSVDEAIKTDFKHGNKIEVKIEDKKITVKDNGRGIPIKFNEEHQQYSAALAFLKLRAGSNFNDEIKQTSIGRFGVGVSLTNIFSKNFKVVTINNGQQLTLICKNNRKEYRVSTRKVRSPARTVVEYELDFDYFKIENYDEILKGLIHKRIYDLAMVFPEIVFRLNGFLVRTDSFRNYVKLIDRKFVLHENSYKFAVLPSDEFSHISFINGIETVRGGTHVDIMSFHATYRLKDLIKKKYKIDVKPSDIKSKILIVLSTRQVENAKFDSQTKERLVTDSNELKGVFKSEDDGFFKKILNTEEIIQPIVDTYLIKERLKEKQEIRDKSKKILKKKIPKLIDANSNDRERCILFITEGDSSKGQMAEVRDINYHAALPLRGKVLNVKEKPVKKILDNAELKDIMSAIGLKIGERADNIRYGKVVILTDADEDGMAITALLVNFFYKFWPEMFDRKQIVRYKNPIYIAKKGKSIYRYYTIKEFNERKENLTGYTITYNKGLGGLSNTEYDRVINKPLEECFKDIGEASNMLEVVFGNKAEDRKKWLSE